MQNKVLKYFSSNWKSAKKN